MGNVVQSHGASRISKHCLRCKARHPEKKDKNNSSQFIEYLSIWQAFP